MRKNDKNTENNVKNSNSFSMCTFYTLKVFKGRGGCLCVGWICMVFFCLVRENFLIERFFDVLRYKHTHECQPMKATCSNPTLLITQTNQQHNFLMLLICCYYLLIQNINFKCTKYTFKINNQYYVYYL